MAGGLRRGALAFVVRAVVAALPASAWALPAYEEVRAGWASTEGVLLDRHGEVIHELRVEMHGRRLDWVQLQDISPALIQTVIRAEDKRFYAHGGVDWLALGDAAFDNLFSTRIRGASTLSMQVAAMLEAGLQRGRGHRTVGQKWDQIQAARELEKKWSKRQILEAYLNLSTFRGEIQGVGAAARALFGRLPSGLDENEALILAALLRGPNAAPKTVARRACAVAESFQPPRSCGGLGELAAQRLTGAPDLSPSAALAPHVARQLLTPAARRVTSTLDAGLQAFVLDALLRQLALLDARNVADAAALVVDNTSGEVLAYVGNSGAESSARYVDGVQAARQAGSTLKPFLYQLAIEERRLTAASLLEDSPVNIVTPGGLYVPQNYDRDFKGVVSLRTALSSSLNVPAVRVLTLLGTDAFVERLRALGFDYVTQDGGYYGYALALGSAEVSLWQLANAYRTLAQGGVAAPLRLVPGEPPRSTRALDRGAAFIITDILADRLARSVGFGLDNTLATRYWAAVKTGTSKDMRDNWCVGFSPRYTVAVWVGNFDGSAMWDVSGITGAAPLWLEIMNHLGAGAPGQPPAVPSAIERVMVTFGGDLEAPREELFLPGTALTRILPKASEPGAASIVYPADGQIIALDPDIPPGMQRVQFQAQAAPAGASWRLDGARVAGEAPALWAPAAGGHRLGLLDAAGKQLDSVEFEVRGPAAAPAGEPRD